MPETTAKTRGGAKTPEAPVLGAGKSVKLKDGAFTARWHEPLVHQSVRAEQAARRRGTAATKTRGLVSGGGAKPWRQKGTGRARAGSSRSPIWTGGGIVFGPQPRSYTFKVNRKEQRAALRSSLSLHAQRGSIAVLDASAFKAPKTSDAAHLLDDWGQPFPTLVVLSGDERDVALSFRNLAGVAVLTHDNVGIADLVGAASLVCSQAALDALTARAGEAIGAEETPASGVSTPKPKAARSAKSAPAAAATAEKTNAEEPDATTAATEETAATGEPAADEEAKS
jgi:large subunit ribosomal protein L4